MRTLRKSKKENHAGNNFSKGLAIKNNFLYFVELDARDNPIKKITVPLSEGCVVEDKIKNFSKLEEGLKRLISKTGPIDSPVAVALPEGDAMIRAITFPDINREDTLNAINLNFKDFFQIPREEAVFNFMRVKTPADNFKANEIKILIAAAKNLTVKKFLEAAENSGLPVGLIEPVNFSMLRAIPEASTGLCVLSNNKNIIASWEGTEFFLRQTDEANNITDIFNTVQFLQAEYKKPIDKIILIGTNFELETQEKNLKIIKLNDEYFCAAGAAIGQSALNTLDLKPAESRLFENQSRLKNHFYSVIFYVLLILAMSIEIGTIFLSQSNIKILSGRIEIMRENIDRLKDIQLTLSKENSSAEIQEREAERIINFLQGDIPALVFMSGIENSGLKFESAIFKREANQKNFQLQLEGHIADEKKLFQTIQTLKSGGKFKNIFLPSSFRDSSGSFAFKLILEL